jgi:hypothetical protein
MSDDDGEDRKPIRDGRSVEARNMDELVMRLREIDGIYSVSSDLERAVGLTFDLSDLDRETAWEGSDIPEAAATLLFEARFVPTGFGREHNQAQDEHLPVIWFETVESVAGRAEDKP